MKLARVDTVNGNALALVDGKELVDLSVAAPELPGTLPELLALGDPGLEQMRAAALGDEGRRPLAEAELLAPVPHPSKFFGVGLNYADHVAETGKETPEHLVVFAKTPNTVTGPHDDVLAPRVSDQLDFEGELGFVIGRRCRHVSRERAHEVIGGYLVVNDFSVRDFQKLSPQWMLGKSFDTHGAIGPWLVTPEELDPHSLALRTFVNGELRQTSNTSNLIFDCFAQVELLSSVCTLEPGDIVATGTPGGVGVVDGRFLATGDVVRVEIEGIGAIENRIVDEPASGEWIEEPAVLPSRADRYVERSAL